MLALVLQPGLCLLPQLLLLHVAPADSVRNAREEAEAASESLPTCSMLPVQEVSQPMAWSLHVLNSTWTCLRKPSRP
jgi:hypothetical protein